MTRDLERPAYDIHVGGVAVEWTLADRKVTVVRVAVPIPLDRRAGAD